MYTEKVMDHFMNPKNMGEIENPDGIGKAGNITCGDVMWLYLKIAKNKNNEDVIQDIKFKTLGCAAAIATSSILTELAKNKTIQDAIKINKQDVADALGGLPAIKIHCSLLATDALNEALFDYYTKNKIEIPEEMLERHKKIEKEVIYAEDKYTKSCK
ncbi:MAG: iron-sulfur cluster assembly scaffold protein [Bacteroidales bacterium]|jgi:nitrogen fixation NifU-like protein|nr:iron-sulfur cluster assembly scaffold protein [Bacteroidales bacterium]